MRVVFQQCADGVHLTSIEAEHQSVCGTVKVIGDGHLSVNGHLHQGGTMAESAQRALDVYQKGGIDALCDAISGEFALMILDQNRLYLIADLFGIVPLYWDVTEDSKGETHFVVSTSLAEAAKAINSIGGKRLRPNPTFLTAFIADITYLLDASHQTISPLKGIQRVPASCRLEMDLSTRKKVVGPYWDVNEIQTEKMDLSTAILTLSEAIKSAVRECFSYGRVAISLSGGIDSGSLAFFASEFCKSQCVCLTAGLEWSECDETEQALRTAKHLGLEFHVVDCNNAFPIYKIEPKLVYKYGLPVDIIHENEVCIADAAQQLRAKVLIYGVGGDELFGLGHTPGYIWDLIRHAKLGEAFRHLVDWTRQLGIGPMGVISAARKTLHCSPPALPPFLRDIQRVIEHLADPAAHSPNSVKERVRQLTFEKNTTDLWWTHSAIYIPRNMRLFQPLLSRQVMEASFTIPQWFVQHPCEYKWLLKQLMRVKAPKLPFDAIGGVVDPLILNGAILAKDRLLRYFEEDCRLVAYDIVSSDIKDYMKAYWQDLDILDGGPGGGRVWWWNTISAEMWLRGFEEEHGTP